MKFVLTMSVNDIIGWIFIIVGLLGMAIVYGLQWIVKMIYKSKGGRK